MERFVKMELDHILTQHGSIQEGSDSQRAIDHLKALLCGFALIKRGLTDRLLRIKCSDQR